MRLRLEWIAIYSLIIVDDESYAVKGLQIGIDWASLGFSRIHVAYSMAMAQETFRSHPIDLMICDIEMPKGNGLQLLEWVNEHYPGTVNIFQTCHADFTYAQRAVQLGSFDYLIKPVIFHEVKQIVERALQVIHKNREFNENYRKYSLLWEKKKPVVVERFWQDVLSGRIVLHADTLEQELSIHAVDLSAEGIVTPIILSIERWHKAMTSRDEEILEYGIRQAAKELLLADGQGYVFKDFSEVNMLLIYGNDRNGLPEDVFLDKCKRFIETCYTYFYCDVSCYVGKAVTPSKLHHMYQMLLASEVNNTHGERSVITLPAITQTGSDTEVAFDFVELAELLEVNHVEQALQTLEQHFVQMRQNRNLSSASLRSYYHGFLQIIYYIAHKKGIPAPTLFQDFELHDYAKVTRSLNFFENWVKRIIVIVQAELNRPVSGNAVTQQVKTYILNHLEEDLTREQLASQVHLNPVYLSRVFKKEEGISLSEYILHEKMKAARDQIIGTDTPISEIATSLGYTHFSHFTKMFKKVNNTTPQGLRKRL